MNRTLFLACLPAMAVHAITLVAAAEECNDWVKNHAIIKTTEIKDHDDHGAVRGSRTVTTTLINIVQTVTEIRKADATGNLIVISRTTETIDTLGGKAAIIENLLPGHSTLIPTSITTIQKTSDGLVTTVQNRGTNGAMRIANRTTTLTHPDGSTQTTVEYPDKQGRLIPRQTINQT